MADLADLGGLASDGLAETELRVENFKSFGSTGFRLEGLRTVNLIVGRNNIGKSAILDAIEILCGSKEFSNNQRHRGNDPKFLIGGTVDEGLAKRYFPPGTSGGYLRGNFWNEAGKYLLSSKLTVRFSGRNQRTLDSFEPGSDLSVRTIRDAYGAELKLHEHEEFLTTIRQMASDFEIPYSSYQTFRVLAERDIQPEPRVSGLDMTGTGRGLTNIICQVITSAKYDSEIVEKEYLNHINAVLFPDIDISNIRVQEHESGAWEIFLDEEGKGQISLSNSGSGLKTVFIVVAATFLLPRLGLLKRGKTIFMVEEPENNLHPALQRRLSDYLFRIVEGTNNKIISTTHSSALIDAFSAHGDSQIVHVASSGGQTSATSVQNTSGRHNILDDLDARASDLLLSNGVVWVEGPSDRSYISRMIALVSDGRLVEGVHYQCVFYGGRLLSHITAELERSEYSEGMNIFRISRNAAVMIDSDKSSPDGSIRLRTHSQKSTVAARAMAERKTVGHRS